MASTAIKPRCVEPPPSFGSFGRGYGQQGVWNQSGQGWNQGSGWNQSGGRGFPASKGKGNKGWGKGKGRGKGGGEGLGKPGLLFSGVFGPRL